MGKQIEEIIETGALERLDYEKTEDVQVLMTFMGVYGVGECCFAFAQLRVLLKVAKAPGLPSNGTKAAVEHLVT